MKKKIKLYGRSIVPGKAQGPALLTTQPVSFFGGLDPESGMVIEKGHELEGSIVRGRVFIFPHGKGSTVGSYVIYEMKKSGTAPTAIINIETELIIAAGCVLAEIPLIDKLNEDPRKVIKTGDFIKVFADKGVIEVYKES